MNILITGANGYIGQRLVAVLLEQEHQLYCCVRNRSRFEHNHKDRRIHIIEIDFLDTQTFQSLPNDIDIAFYLIHSMSATIGDFGGRESNAARNFLQLIEPTRCRQIVYLSGIVNEEVLSDHLKSRLNVEKVLRSQRIPVTVLRAGIVVGAGSASFEIIRDLVEKLPVMVAPRWLNTRCQPIAVRNVIQFLVGVILRESTYNADFDIGGPEVLTYKQMLLQFAEARKLKRLVITIPVMTPRLSSYWLYFVTQVSYTLAVNLVDSMKVNIIARPNRLADELGIGLLTYRTAVQLALEQDPQRPTLSSWKDALSSSGAQRELLNEIRLPESCYRDVKSCDITGRVNEIWGKIWSIGGSQGWYYADTSWKFRGLLDKAVGGVGLNRGRSNTSDIHAGDALDFWRVLVADRERKHLLLFAEMKLPGEGWLEFRVTHEQGREQLIQTAVFRPRGLFGRFYWYALFPFHHVVFSGMIKAIAK